MVDIGIVSHEGGREQEDITQITTDHKLNNEFERERILSSGKGQYISYGSIHLNMTRSLGDRFLKKVGVIKVFLKNTLIITILIIVMINARITAVVIVVMAIIHVAMIIILIGTRKKICHFKKYV